MTAVEHALWELLCAGYTAQEIKGSPDNLVQIIDARGRIVIAGYDRERAILDAHVYLRAEQAEDEDGA